MLAVEGPGQEALLAGIAQQYAGVRRYVAEVGWVIEGVAVLR